MKKTDKERVVKALQEKFRQAGGVILTDYRGLKVPDINGLRAELKAADAEMQVVKNTLTKRAMDGTPYVALAKHLAGPTAAVFASRDLTPASKIIKNFVKNQPLLQIKGGMIGSHEFTPKDVELLADLPSREHLLAQLFSVMQGPSRGLVTVLSGVPRNLVQVLAAIQKKKEAAA